MGVPTPGLINRNERIDPKEQGSVVNNSHTVELFQYRQLCWTIFLFVLRERAETARI